MPSVTVGALPAEPELAINRESVNLPLTPNLSVERMKKGPDGLADGDGRISHLSSAW